MSETFTRRLTPTELRKLRYKADQQGKDWQVVLLDLFNTRLAGFIGESDMLTPEEAADELKVSKWTIFRRIHAKAFPGLKKLGERTYRIPREDVEAMGRVKEAQHTHRLVA